MAWVCVCGLSGALLKTFWGCWFYFFATPDRQTAFCVCWVWGARERERDRYASGEEGGRALCYVSVCVGRCVGRAMQKNGAAVQKRVAGWA